MQDDYMFLKEDLNLAESSIITFSNGYVGYVQYVAFFENSIWYVARLKANAIYEAKKEFDIPDNADSGVLKDAEIILTFGDKKELRHCSRRIRKFAFTN